MAQNSIPDKTAVSHKAVSRSVALLSDADRAAHEAASYVRPWLSSAGTEALRRAHAATQRWQNEQYDAALVERGLAEYREYLGSAA